MQFGHIESELVALFQYSFTPFSYEIIEPVREACHAIAKVVEAKIYAWKGVCHRRRGSGGEGGTHGAGGERWLKHRCHDANSRFERPIYFISWDLGMLLDVVEHRYFGRGLFTTTSKDA